MFCFICRRIFYLRRTKTHRSWSCGCFFGLFALSLLHFCALLFVFSFPSTSTHHSFVGPFLNFSFLFPSLSSLSSLSRSPSLLFLFVFSVTFVSRYLLFSCLFLFLVLFVLFHFISRSRPSSFLPLSPQRRWYCQREQEQGRRRLCRLFSQARGQDHDRLLVLPPHGGL